ncbi:MAG TPA: hypothetical protein VII41_11125, partial [Steroidobacteraceae bacterium]
MHKQHLPRSNCDYALTGAIAVLPIETNVGDERGQIAMRRLVGVLAIAASLSATPAGAQTKVTGTMACGKPEPQHMIAVGDLTGHAMGVEQLKCNWTQPMQLGADHSKDGQSTDTIEVSGNTVQTRGRNVTTMESGDKVFVSYRGTTTTKDGEPVNAKGSWSYTGGTGGLQGIKGSGSYTCSPWAGGLSCDIEGEYEL